MLPLILLFDLPLIVVATTRFKKKKKKKKKKNLCLTYRRSPLYFYLFFNFILHSFSLSHSAFILVYLSLRFPGRRVVLHTMLFRTYVQLACMYYLLTTYVLLHSSLAVTDLLASSYHLSYSIASQLIKSIIIETPTDLFHYR